MKTTRLFLLAACATLTAQARILVEEPDEIFIATRRSHEWAFSMTDADKGRVTVEFRHRIDFPKLGGWCPC